MKRTHDLLISLLLTVVLMFGVIGLCVPASEPLETPKVHHSCIGCYAFAVGSWLWNVSWSEWHTWGYHPNFGPGYQEKHSTDPQ